MLNGVWQAVEERAMVEGVRAAEALNEINMAFSDEVHRLKWKFECSLPRLIKTIVINLSKVSLLGMTSHYLFTT